MFELTPNFDGPGVEEKVKEVALDHDPMSNTDTAVLLGGQSGDATTVSTQQGGSTTQQTLVIGQGEGQTAFVDMHKRGDCAWVTGYTDGHTFICKYKRGGDGKYAPDPSFGVGLPGPDGCVKEERFDTIYGPKAIVVTDDGAVHVLEDSDYSGNVGGTELSIVHYDPNGGRLVERTVIEIDSSGFGYEQCELDLETDSTQESFVVQYRRAGGADPTHAIRRYIDIAQQEPDYEDPDFDPTATVFYADELKAAQAASAPPPRTLDDSGLESRGEAVPPYPVVVSAGFADETANADLMIVRWVGDFGSLIFRDGFETGDETRW